MRVAWLAVLVLLPVAAGHGAPVAREIDERILADQTGDYDYGMLHDQTGLPLLYEGGHDLLALDVREAYLPGWGHSLGFRLFMQFGDPAAQLREEIHFTAGTEKVLRFSWDGSQFASADVERMETLDVGDSHTHGFEAWLRAGALGLAPGDVLERIHVLGFVGDDEADVMPGGYYYQGQPVAGGGDEAAGATWTLQGPPALVAVDAPRSVAGHGNASFELRISSPLSAMTQFVSISGEAAGANVTLDRTSILLDPGAERRITGLVERTGSTGEMRLTVTSDLGAWSTHVVALNITPVEQPVDDFVPAPTKDSPLGIGLLPLLAAAVLRRRA